MKAIAWVVLAGVLSTLPVSYGFGCGLKPLPPLGCRYDAARCYCDEDGNCEWIWEC